MIPQGPADTQPFEVDDFSGGITDFYINGPVNRGQKIDNLDIVNYAGKGKAFSRWGSTFYNSSYPLIPSGSVRTGRLKYFQGFLLPFSSNVVYYVGGGGWTLLTGPTGNPLFPASSTSSANVITTAQDNSHLLLAVDSYAQPQKIYVDGSGNLQVRQCGLPRLASNPTITPGANTGKSFLYRFVYTYTYTANGVTIKTISGVIQVVCANADAPEVHANSISAIPVLANAAGSNYDTSNIKVEIYRTINTGATQFYFAGSVTNGTTTFSDNTSDTNIQLNAPLYTNGGSIEYDPTPPATCVHTIPNGITYYGNVVVSGATLQNRILQSVPGTVDGTPSSFFVDLPDTVVGISSVKGLPIAFCANSVFRLDGTFTNLGQGGILATRIGDTGGCVSAQSIVQTIEGCFWAGPTGFYFTDGYNVIKINQSWPNTYATLVQTATQQKRIQGVYNVKERRIHWTTQSGTNTNADCDVIYTLHLDFGILPESCFTTYSGTTFFGPSSIEFLTNTLFRGHQNGYIFSHNDTLFTDPRVDTTNSTPSTWDVNPIIYDYKSCAFNFGSNFLRKFTPRMSVTCQHVTNLSLQINSITDDGRIIQSLTPIRYRGNAVWGDTSAIWGTPTDVWNGDGLIDAERYFPRNSLRCSYKQIEMTNALAAVVSSDALGNISLNASAKTATLLTAGATWPTNVLNYFLSFPADNYTKNYPITSINSTTVVGYSDNQATSVTSPNSPWVIRATPKGEAIGLLSYTIHFLLMGRTQRRYTYAESGEVGSALK